MVSRAPKPPRPPKDLGLAGRKLWTSVLSDYELAGHEMLLLVRAARCADACDQLQAVVDDEGIMQEFSPGRSRVHPAAVELRHLNLTLARLIVSLRVPLGEADDADRPSARGIRGTYTGLTVAE